MELPETGFRQPLTIWALRSNSDADHPGYFIDREGMVVRLSAGMPGGIGNTGFECGGITSPLVLMGTHFGLREDDRGLPVIFDKGHALSQDFIACHHTLQCREIRGNDRFPKHCIPPVLRAPELFMDAHNGDHRGISRSWRAGHAGGICPPSKKER